MKTKYKIIIFLSAVFIILSYALSTELIDSLALNNINPFKHSKSIADAKSNVVIKAIVIAVDNYADNEMNNISKSVKRDYTSLVKMFNLLESRKLFSVDKYYLKGNKTSKNGILSTIKNINVNPDDVIFVYFSGHGGMDGHGTFLVSREGEYVYRNEIESILNSKAGKLKLLITDACANDIDGYAVTRSFKQRKGYESGKYDDIYTTLFSNYKGFLNIASSSKGEYSWSDDEMGGYFTYFFFQETMLNKPSNSWKELFETARDKLAHMDDRISYDQKGSDDEYTLQTPIAYSLPVPLGEIIPTKVIEPVKDSNDNSFIVTIKNNTNNSIQCYFGSDNVGNKGESRYSEDRLVAPGKSITVNNFNIIYFFDGKDKAACEIENGKFVFEDTQRGLIDLFYADNEDNQNDYKNKDNYLNSSGFDKEFLTNSSAGYEKLLIGEWKLDDGVNYQYIKFSSNNTYEIRGDNNEIIRRGKWEVEKETYRNEKYDVLILMKNTNKGLVEEYYDITAKDKFALELFLVDRYVNDNPDASIDNEEDTIYLLYRS